jgi:hypothetical protein
MGRVLLTCCLLLLPLILPAQDFTSIFMEENGADSTLIRVTISPKMMEEILKSDTGKNEDILEIISSLKSMQALSSDANGESYFQKARKIVEDHSKRFEPYLSYADEHNNCQIVVRKRRGTIVELIMLMVEGDHFAIINLTGKIKPEFISTLTRSMSHKHSS